MPISGAGPNIINFPNSGTDVFSLKRDNGDILTESHLIPSLPGPFVFNLGYVPLLTNPTSTSIPGFTEVSSSPAINQYAVTYSGSNAGQLLFSSLNQNTNVSVTYTLLGDLISSERVNSIQAAITNIEKYTLGQSVSGNFVHISGDTISGTLSMLSNLSLQSASNITVTVSGNNLIGSSSLPFKTITSDNLVTHNLLAPMPYDIFVSGNNIHFQTSGNIIDFQGNANPDVSGTRSLGIASNAWQNIYVDNIGKTFSLASGISILATISGSNIIGSATNPISKLFVDNVSVTNNGNNFNGVFVHTTGDTMSGTLILQSGSSLQAFDIKNPNGTITITPLTNIFVGGTTLPTSAHAYDLGSAGLPFRNIYADSIVGLNISGTFVHISGDTMTGTLNAPNIFGTIISGNNIIVGNNNKATGQYSFAQGNQNLALGQYSNVVGFNNSGTAGVSHIEGINNVDTGDGPVNGTGTTNHVEGSLNQILRSSVSHAEGSNNILNNGTNTSHAEGLNNTLAGTYVSHVEGFDNIVNSNYSHAEGSNNIINVGANSSHVEGDSTIAGGLQSHAEGSASQAFGNNSHAEGNGTTAIGNNSHAEGNATIASGSQSHAGGFNTTAVGSQSYAGGNSSIASGTTSFVQGTQANDGAFQGVTMFTDSQNITTTATSQDSMVLRFKNNINLVSGTNILPINSGTNSVGSATIPFSSVYAKTGYFTNLSGLSPINIQSDLLATGLVNLGSAANPFNVLYANTLAGSGVSTFSGTNIYSNGMPLVPFYEDPFFRYNQQPLQHWLNNSKIVMTLSGVSNVRNYGTWDGENAWFTSFGNQQIVKVNENGNTSTYTIGSGVSNPLCAAWDGRYVWVGSANASGNVYQFDPVTSTTVNTYVLNPGAVGSGGVQGILWDGAFIWAGLAGLNQVLKINPANGNIVASGTGQTNVNGVLAVDLLEPAGLKRYIFTACTGFIGKVTSSGTVAQTFSTPSPTTYRICTDGTYIYGADFFSSKVFKFRASDGVLIATWPTTTNPNDIQFDGENIWVAGNSETIYIHDRNTGYVINTISNAGDTSLIFDGTYMWSVNSTAAYIIYKSVVGDVLGNLKVNQSFSITNSGNTLAYSMSVGQSGMNFYGNSISGVNNIFANNSGVGNIGSVTTPFNNIFVNTISGTNAFFNTITATTENIITINETVVSGTTISGNSIFLNGNPVIVSGNNLGTGFKIFNDKNVNNLEFNTVSGVGSITVSLTNNVISISGSSGGGSSNLTTPSVTTNNTIPTFSGTVGGGLLDTGISIDTSNNLFGANSINSVVVSGTTISGNTINSPQYATTVISGITTGSTASINWNSGSFQIINFLGAISGTCNITLSNGILGSSYVLETINNTSGTTSVSFPSTIWSNQVSGNTTASGSAVDMFTFTYITPTKSVGSVSNNLF